MAKLTVLITEGVPPSLRGELTRWMLELKAGIFVGTLSALVREKLWDKICAKVIDGGAFLIHSMNNEQKFEIHAHGNTERTLVDLDGIKLIRIPVKTREHVQKRPREIPLDLDQIIQIKDERISKIEHGEAVSRTPGFFPPAQGIFPKNFVWRFVKINLINDEVHFDYQGISSCPEISRDDLWQDEWKEDAETICRKILTEVQGSTIMKDAVNSSRRIFSLDIETTDYLPKAYEGFVNILGIAILDFTTSKMQAPELLIHQVFNMTRKKELAHHLLELLQGEIEDADACILFNKNFDLKILEKIIKDNDLGLVFPSNIIDLNEKFGKLVDLERQLANQTGFHRQQTQKSKFPEYYKAFKGQGRNGRNKKLEPLGSYNLLDTLTPLLYYLLNH